MGKELVMELDIMAIKAFTLHHLAFLILATMTIVAGVVTAETHITSIGNLESTAIPMLDA